LREVKLINDITRDKNYVGLLFEIWFVGIVERKEWERVGIHCEKSKIEEEGYTRCQHLAMTHKRWNEFFS
jgi:hypothetical protein